MSGYGSGGARENAGRKSLDGEPRAKVSVTLPVWLIGLIKAEAERQRLSTSQQITELLKKGLER